MKYIDADSLSPAEEWRVYPYNANYEVSNVGRVRNKKRKNILSQRINYSGYYVVTLGKRDAKKVIQIDCYTESDINSNQAKA